MKHKVSELEGRLLDLAVARIEIESKDARLVRSGDCWLCINGATGQTAFLIPDGAQLSTAGQLAHHRAPVYSPSSDWAQGGPIIEQERIGVWPGTEEQPHHSVWSACRPDQNGCFDETDEQFGPTPLVAAMRAYVAAKRGEEVELP